MKKLLMFWLLLASLMAVGQQTTPNLGLNIPPRNTTNWDSLLNFNFTDLDSYLSGGQNIPALGITGNLTVGGAINGSVKGLITCTDTSVVANTITCNPTPAISSYTGVVLVEVTIANNITGATAMSISGLAAKPVVNGNTGQNYPLVGGEMAAGSTWLLQWDGTRFQMPDFPTVYCDQFPGASADVLVRTAISASTNARSAIVDCRNLPPSPTPNFLGDPFINLVGTGYLGNTQGILLLPLTKMVTQAEWNVPTGWKVIGGGSQFGVSTNNGSWLQAGANFPPQYHAGTISAITCSKVAGSNPTIPPIACTVTGSGTSWAHTNCGVSTTAACVGVPSDFNLCSTNGGTSAFCTTSATNNPIAGLITKVLSDTSLYIEIPVNQSNGMPTNFSAQAFNYWINGCVMETGDQSANNVNDQPSNFGVEITGLKIDPNGIDGVNGLCNYSSQNLTNVHDVYVTPSNAIGIDIEGAQAQNSMIRDLWIVGSAGNATSSTIGAVVRTFTAVPLELFGWNIATSGVSGALPLAIDAPVNLQDAHILAAGSGDAVDWGVGPACYPGCRFPPNVITGGSIINLNIPNSSTTALHVGNSNAQTNYSIIGYKAQASGATNFFKDDNRSPACVDTTDTVIGTYFFGASNVNISTGITGPGCAETTHTFYGTTSGSVAVGCNNATCTSFGGTTVKAGFGAYLTGANCQLGGASGTSSPAACGAAPAGSVAIPASQTTYTVNSTAVTANSHIIVQQIQDNSGISTATCNSGSISPVQTSRSAGTSFTISLTSVASVTCIQYWIVD